MLPHLFDPFRRGQHPATEGATRGLGLGLYIASEIVRAYHGTLGVDSDPARGTTFRVELPRG
jgi:signal transduction histidine kinase